MEILDNIILNESIKNADGEVITKMIIFTNYLNNRRGIISQRRFIFDNSCRDICNINLL